MRGLLLGFAAGVCLLQVQGALPATSALLLLTALLLALVLVALRRRMHRQVVAPLLPEASSTPLLLTSAPALSSSSFPSSSSSFRFARLLALRFACGMLAGFLWAAWFATCYLADELPRHLEGEDLVVIGTVDSLPYRHAQGQRFNFAIEQATRNGQPVTGLPHRVALSWYGAEHDAAMPATDVAQAIEPQANAQQAQVQSGERWQLLLRLQRPHGTANLGGFDYEAWLLEQDLRATGTVRTDAAAQAANRRLDPFVWGFRNVIERLRAGMRDRILAALPEKKYAGVIVALVVGDERGVGQSDWKVFNRTGIGHLIAISGLHITLIAGMFARLIYALWSRSFFTRAELPLLLPAHQAAALAGVGIGFVYVLLAGFGVPAQRTLYMLCVVAVAMWMGRIASVSHIAAIALGVVLLLDPWAVLAPGFWLSFGCVALILFATVGRGRAQRAPRALPVDPGNRRQRLWAWCMLEGRTQLTLTLGLVPLTVLLFGDISVISPVANAIAIPLISFVVTPLALAGSILPAPISTGLLLCAHACIELLAQVLTWLSNLPLAVWSAPVPPLWIFSCAMAGTLWLLAPRGLPLRALGLAGWLPLLLNSATHPPEGQMWVTAFDVGQGMAVLIETPQHRLVYDTGPAYAPESDGGNRVILPYLHARGIYRLDGVIVSHNDNDHSGGALSIFNALPVDWVASSLAYDSRIVAAAPHHVRCVAGQKWEWDGVRFEMLQPAAASYESTKYKPNAHSCTVKISVGQEAILLAGDIEATQEDELVNGMPEKLKSTVLLAPHHGSGTSSTLPFLQAVQPRVAIFQVGYRNRFHHPKPEVYARYGALGITRLRTDDAGAISLALGPTLSFGAYRQMQRHYWSDR